MPKGWDAIAHGEWQAGRRRPAIARIFECLNAAPSPPPPHFLQAIYYLFQVGDLAIARAVTDHALRLHPDHLALLENGAVLAMRTDDVPTGRARLEHYFELGGTSANAMDGLAAALAKSGEHDAARRWGQRSLTSKTAAAQARGPRLELGPPRQTGRSIIAFSLWGNLARYLRGALHNVLSARTLYPDFQCRFYIDSSVPADLVAALIEEGAEIVRDDGEPTTRRRLTRRFLVADDPDVARYLVRDCDSVVSEREQVAVRAWTETARPFHVMRDWWTHTDPILAGMWGGLGGVLPPLEPLIENYRSDTLETANWDQWFLRDIVWASIAAQSLVHDRCFHDGDSLPLPAPNPPGNLHVGQNEFAVRRDAQAALLAPFARRVPSLKLDAG